MNETVHADVQFVRNGSQPTFKEAIESTLDKPYEQCQMRDHYGPNFPDMPILTTTDAPSTILRSPSGCLQGVGDTITNMKDDDLLPGVGLVHSENQKNATCYQLNGWNFYWDNLAKTSQLKTVMGVSDVKIQFTEPVGLCNPCDVSYAVSAKVEEDEYIAVGFKGRSWEKDFPYAPEIPRPCYFGMCIDPFDNFTSDRIALGYTAEGGCFREMVAKNLVGEPEDVEYKIMKNTSVERVAGRTILHFTVSQHWQEDIWPEDGPWRIMWAIGKVSRGKDASACSAEIKYHSNHRGVAPLMWIPEAHLGSTSCTFDDAPVSAPASANSSSSTSAFVHV
jgi:hypothetical protein